MRNQSLFVILATLALTACGSENNSSNNANTNNATSNQTTNTSTDTNNATNNETTNTTTATNNPTTGNTSGPVRTEPFITRFSFSTQDDNISNTGLTVSVVGGSISNADGNERQMTVEDAEKFEADHMTIATLNKMKNGWECREITGGGDMGVEDMGAVDGTTHSFEARYQEGGAERVLQDITGCVVDMDPEVMAIIDAMDELAAKYL